MKIVFKITYYAIIHSSASLNLNDIVFVLFDQIKDNFSQDVISIFILKWQANCLSQVNFCK